MGAFLNSGVEKMASYEVEFEELRKFTCTVEVEDADSPEAAIQQAYEAFNSSWFEWDNCYEATAPTYAVKVKNETDDISYSLKDAISNHVDTVAINVCVKGLEKMKEGHLNSIFENEKMKKIGINLPQLDNDRL